MNILGLNKNMIILIVEYHNKYKVIIAGLDTDFNGYPFYEVCYLLSYAENVTKLKAVCLKCKSDNAIFTQKLKSGGNLIEVGDLDLYEPRCANCFIPGGVDG